MDNLLTRLWRWVTGKSQVVYTNTTGDPGPLDAYRRMREPTGHELLQQLKVTAWACASINAGVCAAHAPKLYVTTSDNQPVPKCRTRPLSGRASGVSRGGLAAKAAIVQEVTDHPLLTLLDRVNPTMNGFDLWELTTLYQEVFGVAYWLLDAGPFGVPDQVWILPTQCVTPEADGSAFAYRSGDVTRTYDAAEVIAFRYPDPRDPYRQGLSPLRACYEQAALLSEMAAFKNSRVRNFAVPDAMLWPEEVISDEERDRLELRWNQKMRRGGAGRVLVADQKMHLQLLQHSLGDLAALADLKATKEDVAFAFGVPQPFVSGTTNLANLQAAQRQHAQLAILPRVRRRDSKLNEQLVPLFDPTGRLFFWTDDPTPEDWQRTLAERESNIKLGLKTVNEYRHEMGLPPLPWGDERYRQLYQQEINTDPPEE